MPTNGYGVRSLVERLVRRRRPRRGVFVSAHPDSILKMSTKEVLYRTRNMSFGTDTRLYTTLEQFRRELPQCLGMRLTPVQEQALRVAAGRGVLRRRDLISECGISSGVARRVLRGLERAGAVQREGSGRGARYIPVWPTS